MSELPDPFQCARRIPGISVTLRPEDVTDIWLSLSTKSAEQLLEAHASSIAAQMLAAGLSAALGILAREGGNG